jgi:dipeptidyl aminopeptidase/acylaminoacyl peptidase
MGRLRGPAPLRRMLAGLVVRSAFVYARLRYGLDFNQAAPVRNVLRLRTPVLLIEGSRDTNIPLRHARAIASCGRSVTLWLVPDAGHTGAAGTDPKGFRRRVIDWFEKQASAPAR